jgi:hypothetical protein
VSLTKAGRLRHCRGSVEAPALDEIADHVGAVAKPSSQPPQAVPLQAVLIGDVCTAAGIGARGAAPALALCRLLIQAGQNPKTPLHVWRADMLCLRIRSIGEAARLIIGSDGVGFRRAPEADTAPPVAPTAAEPLP